MTSDDLVDVSPFQQQESQSLSVAKAYTWMKVTWPSGRRTLEGYYGVVAISDLERRHASNAQALHDAKIASLVGAMRAGRLLTEHDRYLIRRSGTKGHRRKFRPFTTVEWIRPSAYTGPIPVRGDLLP